MTRISVYLKSIRTSKYALFEIKIFRNSDFASCAKISVSKITRYTVVANVIVVVLFRGKATHFVNKLVTANIYLLPCDNVGIGPIMSQLIFSKGCEDRMVPKGATGVE